MTLPPTVAAARATSAAPIDTNLREALAVAQGPVKSRALMLIAMP